MRRRVARKVLDNMAANLAGIYPGAYRVPTERRACLRDRAHYMSPVLLALYPDARRLGVPDAR